MDVIKIPDLNKRDDYTYISQFAEAMSFFFFAEARPQEAYIARVSSTSVKWIIYLAL